MQDLMFSQRCLGIVISIKNQQMFRRNMSPHLQDRKLSQPSYHLSSRKHELTFILASCLFLAWRNLRSWRQRRYAAPKRRFIFNGLHGVIYPRIYTSSILIKFLQNLCNQQATHLCSYTWGHAVAYLDEALCNKPEGRGFDSRWSHWIFQLT
jgi:hypothetical protein